MYLNGDLTGDLTGFDNIFDWGFDWGLLAWASCVTCDITNRLLSADEKRITGILPVHNAMMEW